jgi:hypothetical protein
MTFILEAGAGAAANARMLVLGSLEQALQWAGFRPLTAAESASGPFAPGTSERRHVRLDAAACNMAFVSTLENGANLVRFLDQCGSNAWGYDLNLQNHADQTETVNEFRFAIIEETDSLAAELEWLGYRHQEHGWMRVQPECPVPDLGPDYGGEIFPCFGWVPDPGASSEFTPAEQRPGFCSRIVPFGAESVPDGRGYRFVHRGYAQRGILRRRIIRTIDPRLTINPFELVEGALELAYGAA